MNEPHLQNIEHKNIELWDGKILKNNSMLGVNRPYYMYKDTREYADSDHNSLDLFYWQNQGTDALFVHQRVYY